jgi:hypothetical protein
VSSASAFLVWPGLRLNMYSAIVMALAALAWFALAQRRPAGLS